jgi:uracil-DNA glycosylase family 4
VSSERAAPQLRSRRVGRKPEAAMTSNDELRAELAGVAASLRAYLEVQADAGTTGIPRRRASRPDAHAIPPATPAASSPPVSPAATIASAAATPAATAAPAPIAAAPASPRTLVQLAATVAGCTRCVLHTTRTQTVFSRGNPEAALCFIGEAPGQDEDEQGLPFVGRAGQLLDKMIAAMGLSPERDAYICNILKCRPPGNRRPEPEEMEACFPYLHEQLAAVKPKVLVALGNTAVSALLHTKIGISKLRGQWKLYNGSTLVMPTYHPSYLLRPSPQQAEAKRQAWDDLQAVMRELDLPPRRADPKPPPTRSEA